MSYSVMLCGTGCCGCPLVEVSQDGVTISEGTSSVKLSTEEWNLLINKIKSGELAAITAIDEITEPEDFDCGCHS